MDVLESGVPPRDGDRDRGTADPDLDLDVRGDPGEQDGGGSGGRTARRFRVGLPVLAALAAVVLAALAGLGGWTLHEQRTTAGAEEVRAAVQRYVDGWNRHDLGALRAAATPRLRFSAGEHLAQPIVGPLQGNGFDELARTLFGAGVTLRTTGEPMITGNGPLQVSIPQTFSYRAAGTVVTEPAMSLYVLVDTGDGLAVEEHIWWRPYHGLLPSMLWARPSDA